MNEGIMDQARVVFYTLFSALFTYGAIQKSNTDLIEILKTIERSGFDDVATKASGEIAKVVETDIKKLEDEYEELFVLPFGGGLPITASYYYDEREAGAPLVKMRELLFLAKMIKNSEKFSDNEDHFGAVFGFAAKLLSDPTSINRSIYHSLYSDIIAPYMPQFVERIMGSTRAKIYKEVGLLLSSFIAFEKAYIEGI